MIKQFIISKSVQFFQSRIEYNYPIQCVNNAGYNCQEPCLFIGNYGPGDLQRINRHTGLAIVLWCGIDIHRDNIVGGVKKGVKHIVMSHWNEAQAIKFNLNYHFLPLCLTFRDYWKPEILGEKVYAYAPNEIYGLSLIKEIELEIPFPMIITTNKNQYGLEDLRNLYRQCFVGLRLRDKYDGVAVTVQGMGLMGRRTIWNGDQPASIHWKDKADVIRLIGEESKKIGTSQPAVAENTMIYFDVGNEWLKEEFYG